MSGSAAVFSGRRGLRPRAACLAAVLGTATLALLLAAALPARAQPAEGEETEGPPPALRDPYALQVNASPEAQRVAAALDSLRQRGLPAYRTQTTRGGTTYHRLRLGPFPSRAAAQALARCRPDSASAWLTPATAGRGSYGRVARAVQTDVVPLRPRPPRVLLGRENAFAALLMPTPGPGAPAGQPATLRVYAPGREAPAVVERVTGVREAEGQVEYGHAARVFVKDSSETVADYADAIETFSRAHGLSRYIVEDELALYDGERVARFTLLGRLALPGGTPQVLDQPGFDYVDAGGQSVRRQAAAESGRQQVGNAADRALRRAGLTQAATRQAALLARPTAREQNARICLIFYAE